ncbi:S-layer homology domain-containing protein [Cytobacillus sp. FJAT-53684]|uniref:S-layer homology domain-containing protein n=1 Tax=Cytobacillus mangrovibacter TaxID=3299024 RepID=A0ABW6K6C1_9BACI
MKKLSAVLLVFSLLISAFLAVPVADAQSKFKDVTDKHWAVKEIEFLSGKKVIQGYPDGTFKPNDNLTRMQIALMVSREKNYNLTDRTDPKLKDINKGQTNYNVVSAVMAEGIFKDVVNNNQFKPNAFVTRAEMASIMARAYNLTGGSSYQFKDVTLKHWAYSYVQAVATNQITIGYNDGTFKPDNLLTRSQFSTMMARILDKSFQVSLKPTPQPSGVDREAVISSLASNYSYLKINSTSAIYNPWNPQDRSMYSVAVDLNNPNSMNFTIKGWSDSAYPQTNNVAPSVKYALQQIIPSGASTIFNIVNGTAINGSHNGLNKSYSYNGYNVKVTFSGSAIRVFFTK